MTFPLGRAILAMIVCSLLAGGAMLLRKPAPRADLTFWVTADLHARMYRGEGTGAPSLLDEFQRRTGKSVRLDLIAAPAMDVRLLSLFMFAQGGGSGVSDAACPDVVEVSLGSIGKYFRPPVNEVGFLPLNGYLEKSGWINRIVKSRFAPWSKGGVIFGVPHDLHPCTLTYRKDLFDQAGVDLSKAETWNQLQQRCLQFQEYWTNHGHPRTALGLSSSAADMLMVMLRQQHVELVDPDLSLHLTDSKVVDTLCWYAQAVAGPNRIGADLNPAAGQSASDVATGDICALITPDWLVADLKQYDPTLAGKLHMIPLPVFNHGDARTASWGGTMIGITRSCRDPDLAWRLIESLYLSPGSAKLSQSVTGILPPIPELWSDPIYHQPDPFYAGQRINELSIDLAPQVPPLQTTAFTGQAQILMSIALNHAVAKIRTTGLVGLKPACQAYMAEAQASLSAMERFGQ